MRTKHRLTRAEDRIVQLIEDIRVLREGLSAAGVCRMPGITTADRWVRVDSVEWKEYQLAQERTAATWQRVLQQQQTRPGGILSGLGLDFWPWP